jgi:hypothetical protein
MTSIAHPIIRHPLPTCGTCGLPLVFAVPHGWTGHGFRPAWHCAADVRHTYPLRAQTDRTAA